LLLVTNAAFVIGLLLGPLLFLTMFGETIAYGRLIPRLPLSP
jgi:hypothetical protein